jgi:hypothetical protein
MPEPVVYQFTFTSDEVKMLWLCIQRAPLPREATDGVAAAFMRQLDEQNARLLAQTKANGSQAADTDAASDTAH